MQSPEVELVLDVLHIGSRNLIRHRGEPDGDTISEITRRLVYRYRWGPALFSVGVYLTAEGFRRHILSSRPQRPF